MQGLIEAEKEQRKRKRAEGKHKSFVEEEDKPKLEDLEADYAATENGDSGLGDRRSVTPLHLSLHRFNTAYVASHDARHACKFL